MFAQLPEPGSVARYTPRVFLRRLADDGDALVRVLPGTVVFVDVSGFTRLSERLQRIGREGAEQLADAINSCFTALLADAYANGGSLLKFGGDALLLWFEGEDHVVRGCTAAATMRATLRRVGRIPVGGRTVRLQMSAGVHSGDFHTFLAGRSHREYIVAGPAATAVVAMEGLAVAGEILLSPAAAARLPAGCLADPGQGRAGQLLIGPPSHRSHIPEEPLIAASDELAARGLSTALRAHVLSGAVAPEHRMATVTFVRFAGLDGLIERAGADVAAEALDRTVRAAQDAADRYGICLLGSDVAADGGKLVLCSGAPRVLGDDEERMLLFARAVLEAEPPLLVQVGINRGPVFAGDIGPPYRRTYTVMGDTTNVAARLMAAARPGQALVSASVLGPCRSGFRATALPALSVKGRTAPVRAFDLGPALAAPAPPSARPTLPLIGRAAELGRLAEAVAAARERRGRLIELHGEPGSGKSRLLTEARTLADGFRSVRATCEPFTADTPYVAWRDPLRRLIGLGREADDGTVLAALRARIADRAAELAPWLPLLAIALGVTAPGSTPEVDALVEESRPAKLHATVLALLRPELEVPTLVEVEHAHHMDAASAGLLRALGDAVGRSAWLVIVTRRDGLDGSRAIPDAAERLELAPLTPAQTRVLAESAPEGHTVAPHLLALAVERSAGSPQFLLDLLAAAASGSGALPDSIDSAAMARLDALPAQDRALVCRASVLGLAFHEWRLGDVLDVDAPPPSVRDWDRLAPVFARDPDGRIRFRRPTLREAAYGALPFRLRRELHGAVAISLERDLGADADAEPGALSLHWFLAGRHDRAVRHALAGAERARARSAHADAARLLRRALEAGRRSGMSRTERAAAYEQLARSHRLLGEPEAAVRALTTARALVAGDPVAEGRLLLEHGRVAERSGRMTAAVRWVTRGLRGLEHRTDPDAVRLRAELRSALAAIRQRQGRFGEAAALCRAAIAEAEAVGEDRALARALYTLDWALIETGGPVETDNSERALAIFRQLGDADGEASVLNNLGMFAYFRGRWNEAVDLYRASADAERRAGSAAGAAYADTNVGEVLSDQGRLEEADHHLRGARRVWSAIRDPQSTAYVDVLLGRLAVRAGRHAEGVALLEAGQRELARLELDGYARFGTALVAEAHALGGDPATALSLCDALLREPDRHRALALRARGFALVRTGEPATAVAALAASLASARAERAFYDIAAAIDALAMLGAAGEDDFVELDDILDGLRVRRLPKPVELEPADGEHAPAEEPAEAQALTV